MLKEKLMEDLKNSMKEKNNIKKNTVQMVRAAILQIEKDKGIEVDDQKIIEIIAKEVKGKKDAIVDVGINRNEDGKLIGDVDFEKVEREDLINQTNEEIAILQEYLPKQLTKDELKVEIEKIIKELGATTIKDMGIVMKEAKARIGASSDGRTINEVVKELLN